MGMNGGDEPAVAVLWSGLERNPSSIRVNELFKHMSCSDFYPFHRPIQVLVMK